MKHAIAIGLFAFLTAGNSAQLPILSTRSLAKTAIAATPAANYSKLQQRDVFYMSDRFGFRFVEPNGYVINQPSEDRATQPNAPLQVVEIWTRQDYQNRSQLPESPPIISIAIYSNSQRLPLAKWKGELSHNDDRPLTVAGQRAIAYTSTGLYESDNVILGSPDGRYVLRLKVGYQKASDGIRQVFQEVVKTLSFDRLASSNNPNQWRINYNLLQNLLTAGNWQAADVETRAILQRLAKNKGDLFFDSKSVLASLPCEDFRTVDKLWAKASAGRFGYSAQQRLWQQISTSSTNSKQRVDRFGQTVGWRRAKPLGDNNPVGMELAGTSWRLDTELNYTAAAPVGQFPWAGVSSSRLASMLAERSVGCGSCTIDAMNLSNDRYYNYLPALFTKLKACRV